MIDGGADDEKTTDTSVHLPPDREKFPLLTPERIAKGDLVTGPPCKDCNGSGRDAQSHAVCRQCRGRGWNGEVNAGSVLITEIVYAQAHVRNVLNFFWNENIITDEQHDAGWVFKAWRDQHRVALGQMRPISGDLEQPLGGKLRAYGFVLMLRRLTRHDYTALDFVLETVDNDHTRWLAKRNKPQCCEALSCLVKILPPIQEKIDFLEKADEQTLTDLSEGALKKFLAEIEKKA